MSKKPLTISIREATLSPRKVEANRENSRHSTGPTSIEGKAISSRNNFRHGFTGAFCLLAGESREEFDQLVSDLSDEHQPFTVTESILVNDMARHYWLHQRALRMQEDCFSYDLTAPDTHKQLDLFLRYGLTHERAFARCLAALVKLRKDRLALERGFESQERERARDQNRQSKGERRPQALKRSAMTTAPNGTAPLSTICRRFSIRSRRITTDARPKKPRGAASPLCRTRKKASKLASRTYK